VLLEPGQIFASRYRVQRCIAEGGMGAIFEVEHTATERRVALKLLFPHIMSVANARSKFELEAKISARVNSPYIVEVLDAGFDEESKSPFLVMELLEGQTLADRVHEHGPIEVDEALRLLEHVAAGLDAAHAYREPSGAAKPIVHRDLKPENLFLARQHDGSIIAKILDYGIAKVLGDTGNVSQEVRGTPLFMAFEQITAGTLSAQTDVWAFGLIAYHMLTGARYWRSSDREASSLQALFAEILTLPLVPPSTRLREQGVNIELPVAFDAWLLRCIDRDPSKRFASTGAAVEELGRVFDRAPRPGVRASFKPTSIGEKTQTFGGVQAAVEVPADAPGGVHAAVASAGSVPAMATTRHRRSLSAALSSPLHWVAAGAAGAVLLLGAILWIVGSDDPGATPEPSAAASSRAASDSGEPARSVQAARPDPAPAEKTPELRAAPGAHAGPGQTPTGAAPEPVAEEPRVRIAPLEQLASQPRETEPGTAPETAPPSAGQEAMGPRPAPTVDEAAASAPVAGTETGADAKRKPKRKRRPGSTEAYKTRR
jgi:tRNA A-37 threonylcarbamoyl transferase component Bud32